ncbi:TPA: L-threonine dehydrogenase [Salmonella enterica]|nr:L-threonine dehydrogenase [Salmonella enterica]
MMVYNFYMPPVNKMGTGCIDDAIIAIKGYGFKKALIVCGHVLSTSGMVASLQQKLTVQGIGNVVYSGTQPNPTTVHVVEGLEMLRQHQCDCVISVGGGSPHDCAKGIALVATNGGEIRDYEGVDRSARPQLPLIAVNTTAGTASEMTRFCIITDPERQIKMAIIDKHVTPMMSVNDPVLMTGMPAHLTAATGMDALTHAIEAYVSTLATPVTDACALKAVAIISRSLRFAVEDGEDLVVRENMAYGQFLAGMAFNNASLGYVHAMAHQLGGVYNLPHGVCNAILLPHVQTFNAKAVSGRLKDIAEAMGVYVRNMSNEEGAKACITELKKLAADVGIPAGLSALNVHPDDFPRLAGNALKDACALTNPVQGEVEDLVGIFRSAME